VFKGRRFNDITMNAAKLPDAFAKFQMVHFINCFRQCCDCLAHCVKSQ
jgi:hypothetical protein